MSGSEIERILQQIREEEESARRAFHDPAITAKHKFISQRCENIGQHVWTLAEMIGSYDKAIELYTVVQDQIEGNSKNVTL